MGDRYYTEQAEHETEQERSQTAIAPRGTVMSTGFTTEQMMAMAKRMSATGFFGIRDADGAFALMLLADADGLHPATVMRDYHIIQGTPALKADAMVRRFQMAGGRIQWHTLTDKMADGTFTAPDGTHLRHRWTVDDAKRAGVWGKNNWNTYPVAMLRSRCASEAIRSVWPAVLGGMYTNTEVSAFGKGVDDPALSAEPPVVIEASAELAPPPAEEPSAEDAPPDDMQAGRDQRRFEMIVEDLEVAEDNDDFVDLREQVNKLKDPDLRGQANELIQAKADALDAVEKQEAAEGPPAEVKAPPKRTRSRKKAEPPKKKLDDGDVEMAKAILESIEGAKSMQELQLVYRDIKGVADETLAAELEEQWKARETEFLDKAGVSEDVPPAEEPEPEIAPPPAAAAKIDPKVEAKVKLLILRGQYAESAPEAWDALIEKTASENWTPEQVIQIAEEYAQRKSDDMPDLPEALTS